MRLIGLSAYRTTAFGLVFFSAVLLANSRNYHISEQGLNLSENGISASMPKLRFLRVISYLSNDGLLIEHTTNSKPMDLASTGHCNVFVKGFSGPI